MKAAMFWALPWAAMRPDMVIAFLEFLEPNAIAQAGNYAALERDWPITLPEKGKGILGHGGSNNLLQGLSCSQKLRTYQEWLGVWIGACGIAPEA